MFTTGFLVSNAMPYRGNLLCIEALRSEKQQPKARNGAESQAMIAGGDCKIITNYYTVYKIIHTYERYKKLPGRIHPGHPRQYC